MVIATEEEVEQQQQDKEDNSSREPVDLPKNSNVYSQTCSPSGSAYSVQQEEIAIG